jgi:two-component system chemotaxis response regulator CheB
MTMRVLVVDDSSFIRRALTRMLVEDAEISVVGEAAHGNEALALLHSRAPDVVTLDLEMPVAGGLATLRRIMEERPTPVVLVSAYTQTNAERTFEALAAGAVDFVDKSAVSMMDVHALRDELIRKVRLAALSRPLAVRPSSAPKRMEEGASRGGVSAIVVGASTGGPAAIQSLVGGLREDFPLPLLAVQHMPARFTRAFAERLKSFSPLGVKEAEDGDRFTSGIFIAPGGSHVGLRRTESGTAVALRAGVPGDIHVPSLDVAAASVASAIGGPVCLVVLTGMGADGLEGARAVRAAGGVVVAQDEASSVIYGMPRAVAQAGLADTVLPLERIPDWLARIARRRRK